jgi:phosphate transport system protein
MSPARNYEEDLAAIDRDVAALFSLVRRATTSAVAAMVGGDRATGRTVVQRDSLIDSLYAEIEALTSLQFALQSPASLDMAYLLTVLRIVPELERSGDLAEHIGKQASRGAFDGLTPEINAMLKQIGQLVVEMWTVLEHAFDARTAHVIQTTTPTYEILEELHGDLMAEVIASKTATPIAIEIALTARYLDRLRAHAFQIGRRVERLRPDVPRRTSPFIRPSAQ